MECMLVMICILTGFSMSALLTLSVERFLGLKCPLILPSNCRHEKEARDFLRISCGYNSQPFLIAFHWKLNWLCRRNCVYFVVSAFVYMLKLQHVDDRQVKTEKPKYFNYARSWTSQKTNSKFEANFHLFGGCWLFFHLLFSSFIIFGFAIDRRHAFKRSTKPAISYLVVHCFRYELDVQLSNIFLENFNPTPRRNEDGKMLWSARCWLNVLCFKQIEDANFALATWELICVRSLKKYILVYHRIFSAGFHFWPTYISIHPPQVILREAVAYRVPK